eukprot:gene17920-biopygen737
MKVNELKDFLHLRGLTTSGRKAELIARVFVAAENNVPVVKSAEEVPMEINSEYKEKLNVGHIEIPDPLRLTEGCCCGVFILEVKCPSSIAYTSPMDPDISLSYLKKEGAVKVLNKRWESLVFTKGTSLCGKLDWMTSLGNHTTSKNSSEPSEI